MVRLIDQSGEHTNIINNEGATVELVDPNSFMTNLMVTLSSPTVSVFFEVDVYLSYLDGEGVTLSTSILYCPEIQAKIDQSVSLTVDLEIGSYEPILVYQPDISTLFTTIYSSCSVIAYELTQDQERNPLPLTQGKSAFYIDDDSR